MRAAVRENGDFLHLRFEYKYNWETVEDRWVHAARVWQALNCLFIHADTLNAPYLPNAKAYEIQTWYRRTEPRFVKVTILILLLRAAFSH